MAKKNWKQLLQKLANTTGAVVIYDVTQPAIHPEQGAADGSTSKQQTESGDGGTKS